MSIFSKELIVRFQEYFERVYEVRFSEEEAQLHLDSLVSLYTSFAGIASENKVK